MWAARQHRLGSHSAWARKEGHIAMVGSLLVQSTQAAAIGEELVACPLFKAD